ncbi:hypothetical protein [Nostoc sp.]|uniref:hypothetical protein n=1 Tax=Nostoc sp. TaxID=1180 RepID=UPI002FF79366
MLKPPASDSQSIHAQSFNPPLAGRGVETQSGAKALTDEYTLSTTGRLTLNTE